MYKRIRRNLILIIFASLIMVLGATVLTLNVIMRVKNKEISDKFIEQIYEKYDNLSGLEFPEDIGDTNIKPPEDFGDNQHFFFIVYDENNNIKNINQERMQTKTEGEIIEYGRRVLAKGKKKGYEDFFRYNIKPFDNGKIAIFLEIYSDLNTEASILKYSLFIGLLISLSVMIVVFSLSKKILQPFLDNEIKQRKFITDASHELKTPISIISANTEMVEILNGESEWTESTKIQLKRMDKLIKNFIALSKSDETINKEKEVIDLSKLVKEVCRDFKGSAEIKGKTIKSEVQDDIKILADYEQVQQVINILVDNAIKYSIDDNLIVVNLNLVRKSAVLTVGNKIENFTKRDERNIFNRFYRSDGSRSRDTGGFGLGLSIAAKIVRGHNGKINANYKNSWLYISAEFPSA